MKLKRCQKNKNLSFFTKLLCFSIISVILIPIANAIGEDSHRENISHLKLEYLSPYAKIVSRGPTNFIPNDDVEPLPIQATVWLKNILVEDNAGILKGVKADLNTWQAKEDYAKTWSLQSTGLYRTPDNRSKKSYMQGKMLKYLDKRLSGEIHSAKAGTALHRLGQIEKALQPKAEASITSNIKIKVNAKVLEGKTIVIVDNPYLDYLTNFDTRGRVEIKFGKKIKQLDLHSEVEYKVSTDHWIAKIDHPITTHLLARLSSYQDDNTMAFTKYSDNKIELIYSKSF